jgi:hypothetical protein
LIELARQPDPIGWNAERRERFIQRVLEKAEEDRERRRARRALAGAFTAGAFAVLLVGFVLRLLGGAGVPFACPSPELAGKAAHRRLATE